MGHVQLLRRVVLFCDLAFEVIPGWPTARPVDRPVVLRHAPSGLVLTDGAPQARPVRFRDSAAAAQFRRRFLDEFDAWEAVPASDPAADPAPAPDEAGSRAA